MDSRKIDEYIKIKYKNYAYDNICLLCSEEKHINFSSISSRLLFPIFFHFTFSSYNQFSGCTSVPHSLTNSHEIISYTSKNCMIISVYYVVRKNILIAIGL